MAQAVHFYGHLYDLLMAAKVSYLSDTVNLMLLGAGYTLSQPGHSYKSDVVGSEVSGTGYTAGGATLASKTVQYYDANVPATTRANTTAYTAGQIVQGDAGNGVGYIFKCTTAGTSGASSPTWNNTLGATTSDGGTLVWTCVGAIATAWQASHAYVVNDIVRPSTANGFVYRCIVAGTSGASAPAWPTTPIGATVTDNTVTWELIGFGYTVLSAANVSWSNSTITAAFGAVYDGTPASDATRPLVAEVDFGGTLSSSSGPFNVNWDSHGMLIVAHS